jgi:hypothetical protein
LVKEKLHMDDYLQNQEIKGDCNKTLGIKWHNGNFVRQKDRNVFQIVKIITRGGIKTIS